MDACGVSLSLSQPRACRRMWPPMYNYISLREFHTSAQTSSFQGVGDTRRLLGTVYRYTWLLLVAVQRPGAAEHHVVVLVLVKFFWRSASRWSGLYSAWMGGLEEASTSSTAGGKTLAGRPMVESRPNTKPSNITWIGTR